MAETFGSKSPLASFDASLAGSRGGRDGPSFREQIAQKEREMAQLAEARLIEIEDENDRLRAALEERSSAVDRLKVAESGRQAERSC